MAYGKSSRAELEKASLINGIRDYVGQQQMALVESMAPIKIKLPTGKMGKVLYFESTPPELSARMGDLIGFRGRFAICAGRVPGLFNILAPNYRTVQKTADLEGFWKNSYPKIKSELKRKYPKHPWP
jgi:ATP-dependent helicase HrpB